MNIYVGNLSWGASEQDLFQAFSAYGEVVSAKIVTDKITGRSRGFGFVEMANNEDGPAAIEGMNGCLLYTSDAADERSSVDLGGRRILNKKKKIQLLESTVITKKNI